jgi:hypothetical protein
MNQYTIKSCGAGAKGCSQARLANDDDTTIARMTAEVYDTPYNVSGERAAAGQTRLDHVWPGDVPPPFHPPAVGILRALLPGEVRLGEPDLLVAAAAEFGGGGGPRRGRTIPPRPAPLWFA